MRKHKLLREDILPAMASNRKVQRLLNEFMDLLSEYENNENNIDPKASLPASSSLLEPDHEHSAPQQADKMETDPTLKDSSELVIDQTSLAPPVAPVDLGQPVKNLINLASEAKNWRSLWPNESHHIQN